jgi:aryl-alcohol dehydrogenase-like predicted oxidoreductase
VTSRGRTGCELADDSKDIFPTFSAIAQRRQRRAPQRAAGGGPLGEHPPNVALAWLLHQEPVTAPTIGLRTIEHLNDLQRAVKLTLGADLLDKLDAIFPGYKAAPEHYAW